MRRNKVEFVGCDFIWSRSGDFIILYCMCVIFHVGGMSIKQTGHAEFSQKLKNIFIKNYFRKSIGSNPCFILNLFYGTNLLF